MADLMKKKSFLRSGEGAIASYNYEDIASGSGVIVFYALEASTSTNGSNEQAKYFLTTERIKSKDYYTQYTIPGGNWCKFCEFSFDSLPFNTKRILNGRCYFSPLFKIDTNELSVYATITLIKYSNSTEEILGSVQSGVIAGGGKYKRPTTYLDISNVVFKKGDLLRIKFEGYGHYGGGSASAWFYYDGYGRGLPADIEGNTETADSIFYIPFKIDV